MNRFSVLATALLAWALMPPHAAGQSNLPTIVQLPTKDFVYTWGGAGRTEVDQRPEFNLTGFQEGFRCLLEGRFRPNSRLRDFYEKRAWEERLLGSAYFIVEATEEMNRLYVSNELDWAVMDCVNPQTIEPEGKEEERLQKALERAERERDKRREREQRDND